MEIYLNGKRAYSLFQEDCAMTYYIDKTEMLDEIVRILEQKGNAVEKDGAIRGKKMKYLCVTRLRHFGKTMAANMIGAFFGKGFNELPENRRYYEQYIFRIKRGLISDLRMDMFQFPIKN